MPLYKLCAAFSMLTSGTFDIEARQKRSTTITGRRLARESRVHAGKATTLGVLPHTRQKYEQIYGPQTAEFALF